MRQKRKLRYTGVFLILGAGTLVLLALSVCIGSVRISLREIFWSVGGHPVNHQRILWDIRLPRAFGAMILGGALALSGYLLQTFFHNPIVSPFVLGISSGAKLAVSLVMVFFMGWGFSVSSAALIAAAFLGAMLSMGFVLLMSRKVTNMPMLVVGGVPIPALRMAIVILSSLLSACIVAYAGPVSFVGIAAPHLVKSLLGTDKPLLMIPACFLGGSVFCLFCDLLARTLLAPTELSISTVTAIFGAPVVLWIMIRRKKERC